MATAIRFIRPIRKRIPFAEFAPNSLQY
ncbi:hypothetical protein KIPB_008998, partial [Kipferlia bialata]|eukprot:g8998.t1